jgi:hypothetical protein
LHSEGAPPGTPIFDILHPRRCPLLSSTLYSLALLTLSTFLHIRSYLYSTRRTPSASPGSPHPSTKFQPRACTFLLPPCSRPHSSPPPPLAASAAATDRAQVRICVPETSSGAATLNVSSRESTVRRTAVGGRSGGGREGSREVRKRKRPELCACSLRVKRVRWSGGGRCWAIGELEASGVCESGERRIGRWAIRELQRASSASGASHKGWVGGQRCSGVAVSPTRDTAPQAVTRYNHAHTHTPALAARPPLHTRIPPCPVHCTHHSH